MFKFKYIAIVISAVMLCSCGQESGLTKGESPDRGIQPLGERTYELPEGNAGSSHELSDLHEQNETKIEAGKTPRLEGGTEKRERPKSPANNHTLAQLYPDIIALNGPSSSNRIAITFDDGPDRRFTPQVLDILKKHDVKATFFLMGSRVKAHPDVTERIHKEGHAIGNHTFWHPKLYSESVERMVWEVEETDKWINNTVGYIPTLFRAPYGGLDKTYVEKLGEMGKSVIGWSVDTQDWRQISSEEIQHNLLKDLYPGAIILMHCAGDWTQDLSGMTAALDEQLPILKEKGFEFVTVPEVLSQK
ncbi:polysaccharide deacetylase family protein [Paenibacillus sp. IITD108]|uniref:polysaccharide deacetylase family protein n=1 Tax=Paenibacillus sp. IITD108 TaxID=3116649 RepID=UPI002F3FC57B